MSRGGSGERRVGKREKLLHFQKTNKKAAAKLKTVIHMKETVEKSDEECEGVKEFNCNMPP